MFPDFPFEPQLSSFLPHQEVQRYLERYCDNFGIRPHIRVSRRHDPSPTEPPVCVAASCFLLLQQFNSAVENITPVTMTTDSEGRKLTWEVTSADSSGCLRTEAFDAVFICSG